MNKNVLLAMFGFFVTTASVAQINKGSVLLGGSIGASTYRNENNNNNGKLRGISLNPSVGIFVRNNLAVGLNLGFARQRYKLSDNSQTEQTRNFRSGLFVRQYLPLGKNFYLFGEAAAYYARTVQERQQQTPVNEAVIKITTIGVNLYPGIAYAVSRRFHLEASLNNIANLEYSKREETYRSGTNSTRNTTSGFGFNANASDQVPVQVGFRFLLGK